MRELNLAMLGKITWRFIQEEGGGGLWIDILKSKNKGITQGVTEVINKRIKWILGDSSFGRISDLLMNLSRNGPWAILAP
ncbi:hypothetical protein V2J09_022936 [Rumex salicifolius]